MRTSDKPRLTLVEAGGANDMPAVMPVVEATSNAVTEAIKILKAAGYRVVEPRKPRKRKQFKRRFKNGTDRVGPTFVAEFADGTTTRMSVFTSLEKLDWERGERLSIAAYQSRFQTHEAPPTIVSAQFEQDGVVLARRTGESAP